MKQFKISHFKAFSNFDFEVDLSPTSNGKPKHLLVYGTNGTGKTSIQEALRYAFFRTKDVNFEKFSPLMPQEEKDRKIEEKRNRYRNQQGIEPFSIEIDNVDVLTSSFNQDSYNAFFVKRSDITVSNDISLKRLLEGINYGRINIEEFLQKFSEDLKNDVNKALKDKFYTELEIASFDASEGWKVTIRDTEHKITSAQDLSIDFNEANLSLVCLLLITRCVWLWTVKGKQNILVLDDFVTSLDAVNRMALTKYIMETMPESYQLIVLTHNLNYYNIFLHYINTQGFSNDWVIANLIHVANSHRSYINSKIKSAESIGKQYRLENHPDPSTYEQYGNMIRQAFEARLHELIGYINLGSVEDTKNILDRLLSTETIYFKEGKDLQSLVGEIDRSSKVCPLRAVSSLKVIRRKIDGFRVKESNDLINTLRELRLYQKVFMHPMSHGTLGATQWSDAEIKCSLSLLKQLETSINSISNGKF